jgi:UDP-glucose 4-epimerase
VDTLLVTGGAGFVGSHLIRAMLRRDPDSLIISVDNYLSGKIENHVDDPRVTYVDASTVDIHQVWTTAGYPSPKTVYHLGEYSRIVQSFDEFDLTWEYNVRGTKEIISFCALHDARLVYAGSSSKFGNDGRDEHLNPYAWTKAKNVELIKNYSDWYGLDYVITYFYNVYGPGQIQEGRYATVIGLFERQYERGEPLTVVSPGTQTRDFTHISDIVDGILICAEKGRGDGYLLGTGREWPLIEVAKLFGGDYVLTPALRGERQRGRADRTKARDLGWVPRHSLDEYIAEFRRTHARATAG